jgi:murein DD-endopeptidase MepM/ murein hydrolase activator NlpD
LDTPERARAYVASLQRDLNLHLKRLGAPTVLAVDGEWDADTQLAFERVCRILGIDPVRRVRTFRLIAASAAQRTPAELAKADADGAAFAEQLKAQFSGNGGPPTPPAAPKRPRTVVGGRSLPKRERAQAYVAAVQRDLNRHLVELGSPAVLAVDGRWDSDTDLAFRRICQVLGVEPERSTRTFRVIAGAAAPLTVAEKKRAATQGAAYAEKLRHHFEHAPVPNPPEPPEPPPGTAELEAKLRAAGARYEDAIVREARRHGLPVSLVCAVLEVETGFQNVFGHDKVRNPVKSPPGGLLHVTEERYRRYLKFRREGLGAQGVGPMQLTWPGLQDRADALGGCWKVDPNIRVGVEYLAANIQRLGLRRGVIAYNGGEEYADKVFPAQKRWRAKLAEAEAAPTQTAGGAGPRTLKVREPLMQGADVLALQKLLNRRFKEWKIDLHVDEDGQYGKETRKAARRVAYGLGIAGEDIDRGITPAVRSKMRRPSRRTAEERERAKARRPWLRRLRRRYRRATATAASASGNYPLAARGQLIGTPYVGTHTRGNWQSDNALDIRVPNGTPVIAVDDGVIVKTYKAPSGVTAGWQVTLRSADNAWFYGHLNTIGVRPGQRVRKGQTIGTSGSANGVPHLHIGQQVGRPRFQ